jgi:hypothetical protein
MKDGIQQNIPIIGFLNDGSSVSNYNLLPLEVLESEGWSELQEGYMPSQSAENYNNDENETETLRTELNIVKETLDALLLANLEV